MDKLCYRKSSILARVFLKFLFSTYTHYDVGRDRLIDYAQWPKERQFDASQILRQRTPNTATKMDRRPGQGYDEDVLQPFDKTSFNSISIR